MSSLVPSGADIAAARAELAALDARLRDRVVDITTLQAELHALQAGYFENVGDLYAELSVLDAAIVDAEVRAGLRPSVTADEPEEDGSAPDGDTWPDASASTNLAAPSRDLKRMFRDLAKSIHPDLAGDDRARYRRHSLMAEANRAYAERDEDRLRLILHLWERSPDGLVDAGAGGERERLARQIARAGERLLDADAQLADLRRSAIHRLKEKVDDARRQGWDLVAEMVRQVKREISIARARLASLSRGRDAARRPRW